METVGDVRRVSSQLRIIAPVGCLDMVTLERHARLIASDSGGVRKGAFFHGELCVTFRDETKWVELVELDWNHVEPLLSTEAVETAVRGALGRVGRPAWPCGDGRAAQAIATTLLEIGDP